jgi:signal transduction histidine kinase
MTSPALSKLRYLLRPGLSARIAMTIIAALVALQLLALGLFFLGAPEPGPITVYGARWLAEAAEAAVDAGFSAGRKDRDAALDALPHSQWLSLDWSEDIQKTRGGPDPNATFARLTSTIRERLGGRVKSVRAEMRRPPFGGPPPTFGLGPHPRPDPARDRSVIFVPPEAGHVPTHPLSPGEDLQVPGRFLIALEGLDGTWITMQPPRDPPPQYMWPLVLNLAGAGLVITALSAWTSRRILKPLATLRDAVERLGRARVATPVPEAGLGEFGGIARAFNDMQQRIAQYVDERTRILAAMSHDLRTPLTRLRMQAEYVGDEQQRAEMLRQMGEMEAMISATMSFASHDAEAEQPRRIDIAAMLISLSDELNDLGEQAQYSGSDHTLADCQPMAMKRALRNLMENAVKYGDDAQVSLEETEKCLTIRVADKGPGIPEDQFEFVFAPFRRIEASRNRETGGVGLGLTIARDVVRAHGGEITLANASPDGGLIVTVTLPRVA